MKSLAIIEFDYGGHHLLYVRRIAREAIKRGLSVVVFTRPAALSHRAYEGVAEEFGDSLKTVVLQPSLIDSWSRSRNLVTRQIGNWLCQAHCARLIQKIPADTRPDFVLVPFIDRSDKAIGLIGSPFGRLPWGALTMQLKFHLGEMGALRPPRRSDSIMKWLYARLLNVRSLAAVFTIDELQAAYTQKHLPKVAKKVHYLVDPVEMHGTISKKDARLKLGIPDDGSIVLLVFGIIDLRKGLSALVQSVNSPSFPKNVRLLVAGPQYRDAEEALATLSDAIKQSGRVIEMNRFLMGDDEYEVFKASDIVWIGYNEFYGMSDVMIQAAKVGLPIIACKSGLVGWMTEAYGAGVVVDQTDPEDITRAVTRLACDKKYYDSLVVKASELAPRHSVEKFSSDLIDTIMSSKIPHSA
jgi:glycosyltransferase involved in cell wall biosynthesis